MAATRSGSAEITLRGLVSSRWVLIALFGGGVMLMLGARHLVAPVINVAPNRAMVTKLCVVLAVWAAINLLTSRVLLRRREVTLAFAGIHLLVDTVALTILIGITGGPANPFTLLYFVPVTLATQVSPRWTWALAGACVGGFASLFVFADLPPSPAGHADHFVAHMRGMWIAFGVAGVLITYFVQRIAVSLSRQRAELARLREQALEDRHLASLGSLAAGAAHELGTPLGTIQVLAGELRYMDDPDREDAIASIKHEVARCKTIVQQMVTPDARVSRLDSKAEPWPLTELGVEASAVGSGVRVAVEIDEGAEAERSTQPREALGQIVRELLTNAAEACRRRPGSAGIRLRIGVDGDHALVRVRDDGEGMTEDVAAAAFDPFFSTKPEGSGMGLGLYLTRAQVRQLGGTIELTSRRGEGTEFTIRLPTRPRA